MSFSVLNADDRAELMRFAAKVNLGLWKAHGGEFFGHLPHKGYAVSAAYLPPTAVEPVGFFGALLRDAPQRAILFSSDCHVSMDEAADVIVAAPLSDWKSGGVTPIPYNPLALAEGEA